MAVSFGNLIPNMSSWSHFASPKFIMYTMGVLYLLGAGYLVMKLMFNPYKFLIFEKVGQSYRNKGSNWGKIVDLKGQKVIKLWIGKNKYLPIPKPEVLIGRTKFQNVVIAVKYTDDDYRYYNFNDNHNKHDKLKSLLELIPTTKDNKAIMNKIYEEINNSPPEVIQPIDQNFKAFFVQSNKEAKTELQESNGLLSRVGAQLIGYATMGVIGMLIIFTASKYSASMMDDAGKQSRLIIADANQKSLQSTSQIAQALSSIQINGANIPQQIPTPPQQPPPT